MSRNLWPVRGDHVGPNPTNRGKAGTKRSILVDGDGGPLGAMVADAKVNDSKLLRSTIESVFADLYLNSRCDTPAVPPGPGMRELRDNIDRRLRREVFLIDRLSDSR